MSRLNHKGIVVDAAALSVADLSPYVVRLRNVASVDSAAAITLIRHSCAKCAIGESRLGNKSFIIGTTIMPTIEVNKARIYV